MTKTLHWFESYISNRKQYIHKGENSNADLKYVTCGVSKGSILGPLVLLVYVNDPTMLNKKEDILHCLPKLVINNYEIQREESIKVLGILLDQHFTWKEHTKPHDIFRDIDKNLGILYKARPYLDKRDLLCLYYSYICSYLKYANTAWCSTNRTYLKKRQSQEKHALELSFTKTDFHVHEHFSKKYYIKFLSIKYFQ